MTEEAQIYRDLKKQSDELGYATVGEALAALGAIKAAANSVYDAGHWACDRPVDEVALWTALRDAIGREPGGAPVPVRSAPDAPAGGSGQ